MNLLDLLTKESQPHGCGGACTEHNGLGACECAESRRFFKQLLELKGKVKEAQHA
ncbi:hypothetical protein [Beggiatoa leptomitoformis]|uniref:Uncharacterized protein n=1 Tax=Beggiatoa leptomitoformis TaxID=288004 RepID=A0A650GCH0_9GAMM|nr:hypothetical protein [Beggiatoa leptomitoformis]QGX03669.1 hypothetical protein AL038_18900 [Beggiatoa leptomitoformis]QGX04085.1 hypothetical protein BLE401_18620 [Beggiatoa leptomitoformis]